MKNRIFAILVFMLLTTVLIIPVTGINLSKTKITRDFNLDEPIILSDDLLIAPDIFDKKTTGYSPGPGYYDTSEYFIGSVSVGIFLLESNGSFEPSTEDWTTTEENQVKSEIQEALNWWTQQDSNAGITFTYDWNFAVNVSMEPISHPSVFTNNSWEEMWVTEAMESLGYTSGDRFARTREYINDLRTANSTDWGFAVFVVDSSNDLDGCFSDASPPSFMPCAWAYMGGPFVVMTYDNNGWGIGSMNKVMAHETGHIFYATDEYNGQTEYSGYLNAADVENSGCLMHNNNLCLSSGTKLQIGWRDTDTDGIHDIVDTNPQTFLTPYSPDPTSDDTPTYNGSATVVPMKNNNPYGPKNDVSINTIDSVQYRVDSGSWLSTTAKDGTFDDHEEDFTFTTSSLSHGAHTIEAFAKNSVGNIDSTPASDTITIDVEPDDPTITGTTDGKAGTSYSYDFVSNDPDGDTVSYYIKWGDGDETTWTSFVPSGSPGYSESHSWTTQGTYTIEAKTKDIYGMESDWSTMVVTMPKSKNYNYHFSFINWIIELFPNPIIKLIFQLDF
jgi:hypothetical protein